MFGSPQSYDLALLHGGVFGGQLVTAVPAQHRAPSLCRLERSLGPFADPAPLVLGYDGLQMEFGSAVLTNASASGNGGGVGCATPWPW